MKSTMTWVALTAFAVFAGAQSATTQVAANATGSAQTTVSKTAASGSGSATTAESVEAAGKAGQMSASAAQATQVSAVLSKNIDSKNTKVGEEVLAKTTSEARLANGTKIPKGSRLVGHVTEVEPKSHDNRNGRVAFCFDHAVLRGGEQVPIHVLMLAIAAPAPLQADAGASDGMMAGGNAGAMTPGAPVRSAGGMVGGGVSEAAGAANGSLRGTTGMAADSSSSLGANAASGLDATAGTMGNASAVGRATSGLATTAGASGGFSGPVANLSGVMFSTVNVSADASGSGVSGSTTSSTSTMLIARGRNVSLDSGSQMTMAISAQQ